MRVFEPETASRTPKPIPTNGQGPTVAAGETPSEISFSKQRVVEWLFLFWNRRQQLARITATGLAVGILLAFLLPVRYQSSVELMPPDTQSSSGMAMLAALTAKTGGSLGAIAGDALGLKSSGALFVGILRSRTILDRVVQRFDLKKIYRVRLEEDARRELSDRTGVSEDRKSGIITISVLDRDPKRAAAMAQAYTEELDHVVAHLSTSAAHRERVFLEGRLDAVKRDLDQASRDFSEFSSKNIAIDIKEQGKAMVEAAATLQGQLIAAESELRGLEEIYTPGNVRVRAVQARIAELRSQLAKLGGSNSDPNAQADAQPSGTAPQAAQYPSLRQLPLLGVQYADLYRRTKIQEVVYETLTQQYELAKVQEARETPSVKTLDPPDVPERKSSPKRLQVVLLCAILSWIAGGLWVVAQKRWKETDESDPAKVLAFQVYTTLVGAMPWSPPNGSRIHSATRTVWMRLSRRPETTSSRSDTSENA